MTIDDLIGNLKTYELKKVQDCQMTEHRKEKNLVLKANKKLKLDDDEMALLTCRFKEMISKGGFKMKGSRSKAKDLDKHNTNECYKCGRRNYFIRNCPMWELEWKKNNPGKVKEHKKDRVPDKKMTEESR